MPHQEKDPIIQIADLTHIFVLCIAIWVLFYVVPYADAHNFLKLGGWQYWVAFATYMLIIQIISFWAKFIIKQRLKRQSKAWLDKWGQRVPLLRLVLILAIYISLLLCIAYS